MRFAILFLFLLASAVPAAADEAQRFALQSNLDHVWTMTAAALVFFMQAGFMLLEAGSTRAKNSINVAQKNLIDFILSSFAFGVVGFTLMFGASQGGWFGWSSELTVFGGLDEWGITFFVFQMVFAGTAATIVSGAVAERMSMGGYFLVTIMIALFIYPVAGHWSWGGLLTGSDEPFLASMGFMDFAGSTVVHSVGAWVALAAITVIGPRTGKFGPDGRPVRINGHSPILSTAGCLILWVGWIGFNGGSTTAGTPAFAQIVMNTMIAGASGGLVMMTLGRVEAGVFRPEATINGVLGGLVGITAGCDAVTSTGAMAIGGTSGMVVFAATWALDHVLKLDDPVGAIPVHGFAGVWGTVMTAVFARPDALLADSRLEQVGVQLAGAAVVFVFAFGSAYLILRVASFVMGPEEGGRTRLRVSEKAEMEGLNTTEHGSTMGLTVMQRVLAKLAGDPDAEFWEIRLEPGDEAYEMASHFNDIIARMEATRADTTQAHELELSRRERVASELSDVISAAAQGDFERRLSLEDKDGFMRKMAQDINALCAATGESLSEVRRVLRSAAEGDFAARVDGNYSGLLGDIQGDVNTTLAQLESAFSEVEGLVEAAGRGAFEGRIELDAKSGAIARLCSGVNRICEVSEKGLSDLASQLSLLADGDLSVTMGEGYQGKFAEIRTALQSTVTRLGATLREIAGGASEVQTAGSSVARSGETLRSASASQSDLLSDIALTLAEVDATGRGHTESTHRAHGTCAEAATRAAEGVELANAAVTRMTDISEAAAEIERTVGLIQGIARQTHLLSINASVEAAREGGNNAGFRVVAEEVRSLAAQSDEAAARITEKTEAVRGIVNAQQGLVSDISAKLADIRGAVAETADIVGEVAQSGEAQSARITSIAAQLTDLRDSAGRTAQTAEANIQTVQRLHETSERTNAMLARFRFGEDDGDPAIAA